MKIHQLTSVLLFVLCVPTFSQAASLTVELGTPVVTETTATFDVFATGDATTPIVVEVFNLSVVGSTAGFDRFSFVPDPTALGGWLSGGLLGVLGFDLLFPPDPFLGPFLTLTGTPIDIGDLVVDLTGLPGGAPFSVTLGGGDPLFADATDFGGTVGGVPLLSFRTAPPGVVDVAVDPVGVTFTTVPEPSTIALLGVGLACACLRRRRQVSAE